MIFCQENLKIIFNPKRSQHFKYGSKSENKYISHLWHDQYFQNSQQFVAGLSDWNRCSWWSKNNIDNNSHFVFNCESFIPQRIILFNKIELLLPGFKAKSKKASDLILLNGIYLDSELEDFKNKHIIFAKQHFTLNTFWETLIFISKSYSFLFCQYLYLLFISLDLEIGL